MTPIVCSKGRAHRSQKINCHTPISVNSAGLSLVCLLSSPRKQGAMGAEEVHGSSSHLRSVWWPRIVLGTIYLSCLLFPGVFQPALSGVYAQLYKSSFYRLSSYETIETVFFYALIELPFTRKFAHHPELRLDNRFPPVDPKSSKPRLPKMLRPQQRIGEILLYVAPLLLLDFTMIKKFAGVPCLLHQGKRQPPSAAC